ncbi:MAG: hypothetical protein K2Q11_00195 [Burkholderiaceae bacterium]|nr:hypothetical protein [Burkholderiaceae bacterium]
MNKGAKETPFVFFVKLLSTPHQRGSLWLHLRQLLDTIMKTITQTALSAWPEDERDRKRAPARF